MTREHVKSVASESIGKDVKSLVRNSPWWILNGAALLSNFFNTVRGATAAYFFKDYISANAFLDFGVFNLVLYAGLFLMVGEVCNMIGVALAVPLSMKFGKKSTYIISLVCLVVFSVLFFFVPNDGLDGADDDFPGAYLHLHRYRISVDLEHVCGCGGLCRAKGWHILYRLIFSSGSMAQKFGGAFAGWAVMALLAFFGYNTAENAVQTPEALDGLKYLMSFIPAAIAALSIVVVFIYPLNKTRMAAINADLKERRENLQQNNS